MPVKANEHRTFPLNLKTAVEQQRNKDTKPERCSSVGSAWRLARSFRRPAENSPSQNERTVWGWVAAPGTRRRDADWCDRDGRTPHFNCIVPVKKGTRWNASLPALAFALLAGIISTSAQSCSI